jgi:hypothetical protein
VQDVDPGRGLHHVEIDAEHLERRIRSFEELRHRVCHRIGARGTEAVDLDLGKVAKLGDELVDVHAGSAVDLRGPLAGQHSDAHAVSLTPWTARIGRRMF